MTRKRFLLLTFLCAAFVCQVGRAQTTVVYVADTSDFVNPERGFYRYSETRSPVAPPTPSSRTCTTPI